MVIQTNRVIGGIQIDASAERTCATHMLNGRIGKRVPFGTGRLMRSRLDAEFEEGLRLPSGGEEIWFVTHATDVQISLWHLEIFGRSNATVGFNLMKMDLRGKMVEGAVFSSSTDQAGYENELRFEMNRGLRVLAGSTDMTGTGKLIEEVRRTLPIVRYFNAESGGVVAARRFVDSLTIRSRPLLEARRHDVLCPLVVMYPNLVTLA